MVYFCRKKIENKLARDERKMKRCMCERERERLRNNLRPLKAAGYY
jgi:hypothetical protein